MNLEQLVGQCFDNLGANDRTIWRYICGHQEFCQKCSIGELADACVVSPAAVSRFCKKIGLEGYSELRLAIKWQSQGQKSVAPNLLNRTYQDYILTLDYLKTIDYEPIFKFLNYPGRIFAYGTGEVQRHAAKELKRLLININKHVFIIEGTAELDAVMDILTKGDVFIIFSLSGSNKTVNDRIHKMKEKQIPVMSITSYEDNVLASLSDIHIYYYNHCIVPGDSRVTDTHLSAQFFMIVEVLLVKYLEMTWKE